MNIISVTVRPRTPELNPALVEIAALGSSSTSSIASPTIFPQVPLRVNDAATLVWLQVKGLDKTPHGEKVDQDAIDLKQYIHYNDKELAERELIVKEGKVYQSSSAIPLSTDSRKMIWVMHSDGKIYVDFPREGFLFHSSLMNGKKPIAAGELRAHLGRITLLNEQSGHYQPVHRVKILIRHLEYLKLDTTEIKVKTSTPPPSRHRLKINTPPLSARVHPVNIDHSSPVGSIRALHVPAAPTKPAQGCCTVS